VKKFLLGGIALVALNAGSSALAADLSRPVYKALPPPPPVYTWTGCYIGAGGGYGWFTQDHTEFFLTGAQDSFNSTSGGRGWFGTVQGGCDYQISPSFVIGAFADGDWGNIRGDHNLSIATFPFVGQEKLSSSWAVGGRIGYLPMERLMVFVSGGYTQAHFDAYNQSFNFVGGPANVFNVNARTRDGWFIGSGYEYVLGWFPGLTWKTEYRYADYGTVRDTVFLTATGAPFHFTDSHKYVQTVRTELVYRFNWGGPVTAKY
jgi:outer membrane immunogenic protein